MASSKNSVLLSSLAEYGDDSEPDSNPESEETESHGVGLVSAAYGEDDINWIEDGDDKASGDEDSGESSRNSVGSLSLSNLVICSPDWLLFCVSAPALFSEKVRNMSPDKIRIPPEPPGRCSSHLQVKIQKLYEKNLHGDLDTNNHIQRKKEFRNPSIYEKLIQFCSIDELGTNYPKDMFDPHCWPEDSYYEALAKAQKVEMDKLEKAKKDKTKVRTTGVLVPLKRSPRKRKTVVSVTTTASGTKTTVISAVGTILKKAKQ
uniref:SAP30 binding protein n=1 Tax=Oncorhynchus kisutch TaxID=8019 RepID=A0A8C7DI31_ONCKI